MGKGSRQRPCQVPKDVFGRNWDQVFRRDTQCQHCNKPVTVLSLNPPSAEPEMCLPCDAQNNWSTETPA